MRSENCSALCMAPVASDLMEPSPRQSTKRWDFLQPEGSDSILELYPSCPEGVRKAYRDSFRYADPQKRELDLDEPVVQGTFATVKGKGTRSGSLNSSSTFPATLVRRGDKWVIQAGIF